MTPVRPSLLPGEIGAGYLGRATRINGWRKAEDALPEFSAWASSIDPSLTDAPAIAVLARLAGCDMATFIERHTLLPLTLRLGLDALVAASETTDPRSAVDLVVTGGGNQSLFLCSACVAEQAERYGTPYWRREHQIPGFTWCPAHGLPLLDCIDRKAYLTSPGGYSNYTPSIRDYVLDAQRACEAITRYVDICMRLLDSSVSLDAQEVSRTARERALELGLRTAINERHGEPLSKLLDRQYDRLWSHNPWSDPFHAGQRSCRATIDAIVYGRSCNLPVTAYVAAFAAMYPTADSALEALLAGSKRDKAGRDQGRAAA